MDPYSTGIVVSLGLLVAAVVGGALWNERRKAEARRQGAVDRGWTYRTPGGTVRYAIDGASDGVPWTVSVVMGRGEHARAHTRFETPAAPVDGIVLVGPKIPSALAAIDMGGSLVQMFLQKLLGPQAAELAHAREVQVGSEALRARYTVLSTDPDLARAVLTPDVDALLVAEASGWGDPPVVLRWRHELVVRIAAGTWTIEGVDRLVSLGARVRDALPSGP